jgi:hypothetical protein
VAMARARKAINVKTAAALQACFLESRIFLSLFLMTEKFTSWRTVRVRVCALGPWLLRRWVVRDLELRDLPCGRNRFSRR